MGDLSTPIKHKSWRPPFAVTLSLLCLAMAGDPTWNVWITHGIDTGTYLHFLVVIIPIVVTIMGRRALVVGTLAGMSWVLPPTIWSLHNRVYSDTGHPWTDKFERLPTISDIGYFAISLLLGGLIGAIAAYPVHRVQIQREYGQIEGKKAKAIAIGAACCLGPIAGTGAIILLVFIVWALNGFKP